jgi:hypothetical protein
MAEWKKNSDSDSDPTIRGNGKNVIICCHVHKQKNKINRAITQGRTSILTVHLHKTDC